jgi:hypothetical protein
MMPPDQLRSPTAIKVLLPPLELTVAERSLKSAGGVVPLGGGASDISFALTREAVRARARDRDLARRLRPRRHQRPSGAGARLRLFRHRQVRRRQRAAQGAVLLAPGPSLLPWLWASSTSAASSQGHQADQYPGEWRHWRGEAHRVRDCLAVTARAPVARASRDDRRHTRLYGARTDAAGLENDVRRCQT